MSNKVPHLRQRKMVERLTSSCERAENSALEKPIMSEELQKLIDAAKKVEMTAAQLEEQRRSFAFGNANIENSRVTRETVDKAAELLSRGE
jgi:hypothetical protein